MLLTLRFCFSSDREREGGREREREKGKAEGGKERKEERMVSQRVRGKEVGGRGGEGRDIVRDIYALTCSQSGSQVRKNW